MRSKFRVSQICQVKRRKYKPSITRQKYKLLGTEMTFRS